MTEHPNARRTRTLYETFDRGDMEAVRNLMAEDTIWHIAGQNRVSGTYRGIDEVFGFFGAVMELTDDTFELEIHDVAANDRLAVALVTARATQGGRTYEIDQAQLYRWDEEKLTEVRNYPFDHEEYEELWS